jgi:hypothetical protein
MTAIEDLLRDIDARWTPQLPAHLTLRILGSTALMLQSDYRRGTKDGDVLETPEITPAVKAPLLRLAGKGTPLHHRHRMYLEVLGPFFPFLPEEPVWHRHEFDPPLLHLRVEVLDVTDVCVAKLARFHSADREDIKAMADDDLVDPQRFVARFQSAAARWRMDARADRLPAIIRNFRQVQRDVLFVTESEEDLPPWCRPD